ncbi:SRPBCC domain-containing protein [Streptomyces sp. NPDC021224]|uniref:SRPBCC domain-containing protein n=1 Tax=unclassified Streptomyces TaxID=2593676 RepID=UPI0037B05EFF
MEHESFVPGMTTARMVQALRTPEVVSACLPGWQPDADAGEGGAAAAGTAAGAAAGRLRLRVGGSTITYRGTVAVDGTGPGFTLTAAGTEVRGGGGVTVAAELVVVAAVQPEPGVTVVWRGEAAGQGRITTFEPALVEAAARRLLDRFCTDLAAHAPDGAEPEQEQEPGASDAEAVPGAGLDADPKADVVDDDGEPVPGGAELEDFDLVEVEVEVPESAAALDDLVPPAEAAHARRTMIGRSAEEVDHAPPRGRYAPVPAPDSPSAAATLRWAAPVAAALVASAVVVSRALRRRG